VISEAFDQVMDLLFRFAEFVLDPAHEFFFLALHEEKVIVGQFGEFLLELAGEDFPIALNFEFVHVGFLDNNLTGSR
jgi:hypothetical protein